jgi:SAM-dependent methyltransferase
LTEPAKTAIDADAFNAFEATGWDEKADAYFDFWSPITALTFDAMLDAAAVGAGTRLLDVGCGPGELAAAAAARGAIATGLDVAPAMVELASGRHPELTFVEGNAEALPFEDRTFDAVTSNFVLLHLGRPEEAAAEWVRVLAPAGRLALSIWDATEVNRLHGLILDAVASVDDLAPVDIPEGPPAFRDDRDLTAILKNAGLTDVRIDHRTYPVAFADPAELWVGILRSGVRFPPLINAQPPETQGRIRAAFDELANVHARPGGGIEVPAAVQIASGRRP